MGAGTGLYNLILEEEKKTEKNRIGSVNRRA